MSEHFSLQWDNFHKNMSAGMQSLLESEDLVDVTLAVEGRHLKAHKMVLSLCSPYFRQLFQSSPCKHPIVFMKDVSYIALSDLLQFMYQGEVQVAQENLTTFIKTAEALQIKGLTGDSTNQNEEPQDTAKLPNETIKRTAEVLVPSPIQTVTRLKKYSGPASKRVRVSSPSPSSSAATPIVPAEVAVETENSNVTSNIENALLMKMEPSDNIEASTAKEVADQSQDSYVDESLVEEDAEDYTLMETNEDDPKPGTSFDGIGESQDTNFIISKYEDSSVQNEKKKTRTRYVFGGFVYHNKLVAGKPPIREEIAKDLLEINSKEEIECEGLKKEKHILEELATSQRRRCVSCYKKLSEKHTRKYAAFKAKQTRWKCVQCNKYYCVACFTFVHKCTL